MSNERLPLLSKKALALPEEPGVYLMRDKAKKIIYIGKAKILKNRVSQYFRQGANHPEKVRQMVEHVFDFDFILCTSEFEALILECSLIKQYSPKYNILLKDDKGYHYIRVSPPPWQRISEVKQIENDGAKYYGPYYSGYMITQSIDAAGRIFQLPRCSKVFPRDIGKGRPCLNYSIGLCCAPCVGKLDQNEYDERVQQALKYILNGSEVLTKTLEQKMNAAAERLDFEAAAAYRDRISAMKKITDKQHVILSNVKEQDVIAMAKAPDAVCFEVFCFQGGKLYDRNHYIVESLEDDARTRADFLVRYYSIHDKIPAQITLDDFPADIDLLQEWFNSKSGRNIHIHIPQRGRQLELVKMCAENAAERLLARQGKTGRQLAVLDELALLLGMDHSPRRIESYDISHTSGSETVGGMIVFRDAKPYKAAYRRFKIRQENGADDCASMAEMLDRRFSEYRAHCGETNGFAVLPDLIFLDGGSAQLAAVLPILKKYGIDSLPVFGMVKDERHRTRALVSDTGEIQIKQTRAVYTLISTIQDEVHRFAVTYHRRRVSQKVLHSPLLDLPGIGPKKAQQLLLKFGSLANIQEATDEQLLKVAGITPSLVRIIRENLNL